MRQIIITGVLFILMLYITGCATIMSHGPQTLPILSQPEGADCEIVDVTLGASVAKAKTPYTATLERGAGFFRKKYYDIKITKDGYISERLSLTPEINGWYFGNLLFGGVLGMLIVDPATGSMWTFSDDHTKIKLYRDTPEGRALKIADEKTRTDEKAKQEKEERARRDSSASAN